MKALLVTLLLSLSVAVNAAEPATLKVVPYVPTKAEVKAAKQAEVEAKKEDFRERKRKMIEKLRQAKPGKAEEEKKAVPEKK
jgi:hypothetical protein